MQTEQQIIRIKHLLNNKSLSFIIGAGFSKNMSNKFFDWGDLLKPIITEMYHIDDEKEIEQIYVFITIEQPKLIRNIRV